MRRSSIWVLVLVITCLSFSQTASAWPWRRRTNNTTTSRSWPTSISSSDQARAQYKAGLMARQRRMSHGVAPLIGHYEGIGRGTSRYCSTCTPRRGMTLTADAAVRSSGGTWYRVRAWR